MGRGKKIPPMPSSGIGGIGGESLPGSYSPPPVDAGAGAPLVLDLSLSEAPSPYRPSGSFWQKLHWYWSFALGAMMCALSLVLHISGWM